MHLALQANRLPQLREALFEVRSDGSLYMTGPPSTLASTAFALADPALSLFEGKKLDHVVGTLQSVIAIDQPALGQSLSAVQINLAGVITPLPEGASGRIDFTWNGTLIDSIGMSNKTALTPQINVSAEQLRRNNQLGIQLSYVPTSGECTPQPLSARLDIDTAQSFVIPTSGDSVPPGFERFPQVLGSTVPIALGAAGDPASLLQQAGDLIAVGELAIATTPCLVGN